MTRVTVLGVTGGAGATTLAALIHLAYRGDPQRRPALNAHDAVAMRARLGSEPHPASRLRSVADAGRFTPQRMDAAIAAGVLLLAAPVSAGGDEALARVLARAGARLSSEQLRAIGVVRVAVHGPRTGAAAARPVPAMLLLPFDRALAAGVGIEAVWSRLAPATRSAVRQLAGQLERSVWGVGRPAGTGRAPGPDPPPRRAAAPDGRRT